VKIPGMAESLTDGALGGEVGAYVGDGWMDGTCLMDDQVSRLQHSPDSPTHTNIHTPIIHLITSPPL